MPRSSSRSRSLALALVALGVLTACEPSEVPVDDAIRDSVVATSRQYAEAVASQLGTTTEVQQDAWADCRDAASGNVEGEQYFYNLRVELDGDETFEVLNQRLSDHFAAEGWTLVESTGSLPRVRWRHGGYSIGTTLEVERGYATIGVGAGCIATLADVPEQSRPTS